MKKIIYDWAVMMLLIPFFFACSDEDDKAGNALSVASFYPVIVMEGTEVTITGSSLDRVTEVIFPGGQPATSLEVVDAWTLRAKAPANVSKKEAPLVIRSVDEEASSRQTIRQAKPQLYYFTPAENIETYKELSIIGNDLLLADKVTFVREEESLTIEALDFLRKSNTEIKLFLPEETPTGEEVSVSLIFKNGERLDLGTLNIAAGEGGGSWVEKEITLYEGEPVATGNWSNVVHIRKELFASAKMGDVIRVYTTDLEDGAQGSLKNGSTWAGLTEELGYFDISGDYYDRTIDETMLEQLVESGMIISGQNYTIVKASLFTSVWVDDNDAEKTDPITPETILLIDYEDTGDHNADWDKSWADGEATEFVTDTKGNVYMHLVKPVTGWMVNCNHLDKGTVSGIENYTVKFDIMIEEGTVGASRAEMQFIIGDKWLWVGAGMFPESTDGKWITVSYNIADLSSELTGDLTIGTSTNGLYGGSDTAPIPSGICLDNLRLDPKK